VRSDRGSGANSLPTVLINRCAGDRGSMAKPLIGRLTRMKEQVLD
jgi:hypothetical protein